MEGRVQSKWVLRRIGPPPSLLGISDTAELKLGPTVFGRSSVADVYIDSQVLKNFISRKHAVVIGEKIQDGRLRFVLYNHGLNGTYINDVRIGESQELHEGDKVIFGHKNGYKVKVGETATQPDSEFQFVLERVTLFQEEPLENGEHTCEGGPISVSGSKNYDRSECCALSPAKNVEVDYVPKSMRAPKASQLKQLVDGVTGQPRHKTKDEFEVLSPKHVYSEDAVSQKSEASKSASRNLSHSTGSVTLSHRLPQDTKLHSQRFSNLLEKGPVSPMCRIKRIKSRSSKLRHLDTITLKSSFHKQSDDSHKSSFLTTVGSDEPPVLTPESFVRTPSPSYVVDHDDDEKEEEDERSDGDSVMWEIPPTPGRGFSELCPSPHHVQHGTKRQTSPPTLQRSIQLHVQRCGAKSSSQKVVEKHNVEESEEEEERTRTLGEYSDEEISKISDDQKSPDTCQGSSDETIEKKDKPKQKQQKLKTGVVSLSDKMSVKNNIHLRQSTTALSSRNSQGKRPLSPDSDSASSTEELLGSSLFKPDQVLRKKHFKKQERSKVEVQLSAKSPMIMDTTKRKNTDEHLLKDVRVKVERATADNYVKRAKISSTWLIGKIPRTPPGNKGRPPINRNHTHSDLKPTDKLRRKPASCKKQTLPDKDHKKSKSLGDASDHTKNKERKSLVKDKSVKAKKDESVDFEDKHSFVTEIEKVTSLKNKQIFETNDSDHESNEREKKLKEGTNISLNNTSGDERHQLRPVRKVAMRRPRMLLEDKDGQTTDSSDGECKLNRRSRGREGKKMERRSRRGNAEDDRLEDGVQWYEEESCESSHCHRPSQRRVAWVQCDDCDRWYHTVCVGISYESVKVEDEEFHCGCV